MRTMLEDGFAWIVHGLCEGRPTEMDHVEAHWSHERIATEYLRKAVRSA